MAEERAGEYLISPEAAAKRLVRFLPPGTFGPIGGIYITDNGKLLFETAEETAELAMYRIESAYRKARKGKLEEQALYKHVLQAVPFTDLLSVVAYYDTQLQSYAQTSNIGEVRSALIAGAEKEELQLKSIRDFLNHTTGTRPRGKFRLIRTQQQVGQGIATLSNFYTELSLRTSVDHSPGRRR